MATPRHRRTPPPASAQVGRSSRVPVIDIYARISRAVDGSTIKVDHQVELGTESIEERGAQVGEVFTDPSMSAWKPRVIRKNWIKLMERLETGASDGVWVLDATRFSRKPIEGERLIEAAAGGAKVWSYSSEYDLTSADGRAAFRAAMTRAAEESDRNSERVRRGKLRRVRKGRIHGGVRGYAMPGFGPKPEGWDPDEVRLPESQERVEAEREIVRDAYRRLLAGTVSMARLAGELNERGQAGERAALPVAGGHWTYTVLGRSLTRPALAGKLVHKGEDMGTLAGVEPVVSQEDWERLCALLASRKRGRPPVAQHPLSSLMMCECGRSKLSARVRSDLRYDDGEPRREYRCRTRSDLPQAMRGCGRNSIDARAVESAVFAAVVERLSDPRRAEHMAAHLGQVRAERSRIEADIARWDETATELAMKTASWGVARVEVAMVPILAQIEGLKAELAALDDDPASSGPAATADAVAEWHQAVASGDIAAQRTIIKRLFPRLTLRYAQGRGDYSARRIALDGLERAAA